MGFDGIYVGDRDYLDYYYYYDNGGMLGKIEEEMVKLWNCMFVIYEGEVYCFNLNIRDFVSFIV